MSGSHPGVEEKHQKSLEEEVTATYKHIKMILFSML